MEVPVFVSVALIPGATYAVVLVAVKAGVLTKSVTVIAPLADEGIDEAVGDNAVPETLDGVMEASVAEAVITDDVEAGEADSESAADTELIH